jgi:multiple antibiotic resistance protein
VDLDFTLLAQTFVTVLAIMDPLGNVPVFLALTKGFDRARRNRAAVQGVLVAAGVITTFAAFGEAILDLLGISIEALQVAGGLLLVLLALELLRPGDGAGSSEPGNVALVPLGTPLLAGPGTIATAMLYVERAEGPREVGAVALALGAALVAVYLAMRFAGGIARILRDDGIDLVSRVMGFILAAIAVQLIANGIASWVHNGV